MSENILYIRVYLLDESSSDLALDTYMLIYLDI